MSFVWLNIFISLLMLCLYMGRIVFCLLMLYALMWLVLLFFVCLCGPDISLLPLSLLWQIGGRKNIITVLFSALWFFLYFILSLLMKLIARSSLYSVVICVISSKRYSIVIWCWCHNEPFVVLMWSLNLLWSIDDELEECEYKNVHNILNVIEMPKNSLKGSLLLQLIHNFL